jgi:hypothetical protein
MEKGKDPVKNAYDLVTLKDFCNTLAYVIEGNCSDPIPG